MAIHCEILTLIYAARCISGGPKLGKFVVVSAVIHMEYLMVIFFTLCVLQNA